MMGGIIGGANTRVEWKDHRSSGVNQTTFTANSVPFGDASPRRWIIVSFRCSNLTLNLAAPNACTIGGVAATLILQDPAGTSLSHRQIWIAKVPTGTSGTITVTRAANMTGQVLNVWAAYDLQSAVAVDTEVSTFADPGSGNLTCQSGGIAIGYADEPTTPPGFTWTGLTEDVDAALGAIGYAAASLSKTAGGSLAITADTDANCSFIAASFR